MTIDPRTPVIVGVGQVMQRSTDPEQARRPLELMIDAVRAAAEDAGAPSVASRADAVGVVGGLWDYPDPGRLIADEFGAAGAHTALSAYSGSMAQHMLTVYAERIQAGELDIAVITGGEAQYSASKRGESVQNLARVKVDDAASDEFFGGGKTLVSKPEHRMGFSLPIIVYPLFGSAVRAHRRMTQDAYRDDAASIWAEFSRVAAANPYAWVREAKSPTEIREPGPANRMISWPYTKAMNANMFVDQSAAVILCSSGRADELGVPLDRRVFPLGAADAADPVAFTQRLDMHGSPAIRLGGEAALELARTSIDEIAHFDLYSCFPSIVQISTAELHITDDRQLTQTGGLSFFGGPLNSYTLHGIASMTDTLRANAGDKGLVHGNGGHMSKQSICVYSTEPPEQFRRGDAQDRVDALPHRALDEEYSGGVTIESCTVLWGRDAPVQGYLTGLTDRGNRVLAVTTEEAAMEAIMVKELIGEAATVDPDGQLHL